MRKRHSGLAAAGAAAASVTLTMHLYSVCLAHHYALLPSLIPRPALVQLGAPAASLPSVLPHPLLPYSHSPPTFIHSSLLLPQCYSRLPHSPSPHSLQRANSTPLSPSRPSLPSLSPFLCLPQSGPVGAAVSIRVTSCFPVHSTTYYFGICQK